jgi:hypothetical protein
MTPERNSGYAIDVAPEMTTDEWQSRYGKPREP